VSIASLVQRLQDRPAIPPQAAPEAGRSVRTVAPGANAIFQAVRTREPAPMLAIRPVFAPVALFAPETARVQGAGEESAPAGLSDEAQREAFEERAAIMEFDGGLTRADAETTVRGLLADGEVSASVARACTRCQHYSRRRTCLGACRT